MTAKPDKKAFIFLSIAFVEGAVVMACELLGAKMTAPFFGTTIYSWAAVLAVTLGGLAGERCTDDAVASRFPDLAGRRHHGGLAGAGAPSHASVRRPPATVPKAKSLMPCAKHRSVMPARARWSTRE